MTGKTGSRVLNKIAGQTITASGNKSTARTVDPLDSSMRLEDGSDITIRDAVNKFVRNDVAEKTAKEQKEDAASILREYATQMRDTNATNGDYQKTYRILGNKNRGVQQAADLSQTDKFSIPKKDEDINALKSILGDRFSDYLEREVSISIRPEVLKNRKLRTELSKRLAEAFGDDLKNFFVKEEVWATVGGIDQRQYELDDTERVQMREKLKPAKDSVKNTSYTTS